MTISGIQIATQRNTAVEELAPLLNDARPVVGVMNFNILDQLIEQLREAYPAEWILHTVAVNSIGLPGVLEHFRARGLGAATSSASELEIAYGSGFAPHELVHHAPANTWSTLRQLVDAGLSFSVDNFSELSRVDELFNELGQFQSRLGLYITAQTPVDDDDPALTPHGVGLRDHRQEILQAYAERPWLQDVHLNFATPPTSLQQAAEHIAAIYRLAEDIEQAAGSQRIRRIYLPEELPVHMTSDDAAPSIENHRFVQQAIVPELFDGKYEIVTDFTRELTATAGMILARVEYTKDLDRKLVAVTHADIPSYQTSEQPVRIEAYDADGDLKDDTVRYYYDVAGPGGMIAHQVELPSLEAGDVLAILNVGATSFGPHNTCGTPVYGIRADGLLTETSLLRQERTAQDVAQAVGVYQPRKVLH